MMRNQWIQFSTPDAFQCTQVLESLLENIYFAIGEPLTLGFSPFFTQNIDGESLDDVTEGAAIDGRRADDSKWNEWSQSYLQHLRSEQNGGEPFERNVGRRKEVMDLLM